MISKFLFRFGGYGPKSTSFSMALKFIGDHLIEQFGKDVDVKYIWNVMDLGYRGEDILWLVEHGILTLAYQSTSYLTDRVPELSFVDLPFLFRDNQEARDSMDGALGKYLSSKIEDTINYRVLGYLENGFRHISNKLRPIRDPKDLKGLKIRVLPSETQSNTFRLLGADPRPMDLTEAIEAINKGTIDAQENPFANTTTYNIHKFHNYHTMTKHFYISRGIFANRSAYYSWPREIRDFMQYVVRKAITFHRNLAEKEHRSARKLIEAENCEIIELTEKERINFYNVVQSQHKIAKDRFGAEMLNLIGKN
ncbi:MAG: TRAP transporter substrate-binding protein [Pseudomonadota bacterium]|nr:TRAP transporter substrate-binding protein [Pseudomonadota bacterium]